MSTDLVKQHVDLSPSSSHRWMNCGGSVQLSKGIPKGPDSIYAAEGTAAHALAQTILEKNYLPSQLIGKSFNGFEVTEEMAEYVAVYTDYCNSIRKPALDAWSWVERRISLAPLAPPTLMEGTSDFTSLYGRFIPLEQREQYRRCTEGVLEVVDLKYGVGLVEVEENPQELYYALGALLSVQAEKLMSIDLVRLTIVQPRAAHKEGPIRSWEISIEDLLAWTFHLFATARRALSPDAPLNPGEWCRWCPAAGVCPALRHQMLALAQDDFSDIVDTPPNPVALAPADLGYLAERLPILDAWSKAVWAEILRRLEASEAVPGFKLVAKRAMRKWGAADDVTAARLAMMGATKEDIIEEKLKSVAQVEKALGKKKFTQLVEGAEGLISKVSSGYTVAADADVRPAITSGAQSDFEAIE